MNIYHHAHSWFRLEDATNGERRCIVCKAGAVHVSRNRNPPPCNHLKLAGTNACSECKKNNGAGWQFWIQEPYEPVKYITLPRWSMIKDTEQIKQIQKATTSCVTENDREIGNTRRLVVGAKRSLTENCKKLAFLKQIRISMRSRQKMEMKKNSQIGLDKVSEIL